jgi:hypothetical protein
MYIYVLCVYVYMYIYIYTYIYIYIYKYMYMKGTYGRRSPTVRTLIGDDENLIIDNCRDNKRDVNVIGVLDAPLGGLLYLYL